ncbi:hypothetical protein RFI_16972, partial [Reticulomyxa filosa]
AKPKSKMSNYRLKDKIEGKLEASIDQQKKVLRQMQQELNTTSKQIRIQLMMDQKLANDVFEKVLDDLQQQIEIQQQLLRVALQQHQTWLGDVAYWEDALENQYWKCKTDAESKALLRKVNNFITIAYASAKFCKHFVNIDHTLQNVLHSIGFCVLSLLILRYDRVPLTQKIAGSLTGKAALKPINVVAKIVKKLGESANEKERKPQNNDVSVASKENNKLKKNFILRVEFDPPKDDSSQISGYVVQLIQRDFEPKISEVGREERYLEIELPQELKRWCGDVWVQSQNDVGLGEATHIAVDLAIY